MLAVTLLIGGSSIKSLNLSAELDGDNAKESEDS